MAFHATHLSDKKEGYLVGTPDFGRHVFRNNRVEETYLLETLRIIRFQIQAQIAESG